MDLLARDRSILFAIDSHSSGQSIFRTNQGILTVQILTASLIVERSVAATHGHSRPGQGEPGTTDGLVAALAGSAACLLAHRQAQRMAVSWPSWGTAGVVGQRPLRLSPS